MKKIKILLADGSRLFLELLSSAIENETGFVVVSQSESGVEAIRDATELRPDVVVLGSSLPDLSALQIVKELRRDNKPPLFLFIVAADDPELLSVMKEMESVGAVREKSGLDEFMTVLRALARGESHVTNEVIAELRQQEKEEEAGRDRLREITQREREVLYWLAKGQTNREISKTMYLSEKTIKNHVSHLLKKLELTDRTKAAAFAWSEGLPLIPEEFFSSHDIR